MSHLVIVVAVVVELGQPFSIASTLRSTLVVADLNLKILRDSGDCPGACQVIHWVKGCFDALDKKYVSTGITREKTKVF